MSVKNIVLKKALIYIGVLTVIALAIDWLNGITIGTRFEGLRGNVLILVVLMIIFDIGRSIKKEHIRKKYIMYASVLIGQIAIVQFVSFVTGVGTVNTWLAAIGVTVMFSTLVILMFDIAKSTKRTHSFISILTYFIAFMTILAIIIVNLIFWIGLMGTSY